MKERKREENIKEKRDWKRVREKWRKIEGEKKKGKEKVIEKLASSFFYFSFFEILTKFEFKLKCKGEIKKESFGSQTN